MVWQESDNSGPMAIHGHPVDLGTAGDIDLGEGKTLTMQRDDRVDNLLVCPVDLDASRKLLTHVLTNLDRQIAIEVHDPTTPIIGSMAGVVFPRPLGDGGGGGIDRII